MANITTIADATLSGSGAGIAVGVVVTDAEAFINSTAATPVTAQGLTVSADTNNTAPTTGRKVIQVKIEGVTWLMSFTGSRTG